MSFKIILVRHGQSLANVNPLYYYNDDSAIILTETGVQQSLVLASALPFILKANDMHIPKTTFMSSRLIRAKLTANIVSHKVPGIKILRDERLNECEWDAKNNRSKESDNSIRDRFRSVINEHQGHLVLFTHGEVMAAVDITKGPVGNCEWRIYNRNDFINNNLSYS